MSTFLELIGPTPLSRCTPRGLAEMDLLLKPGRFGSGEVLVEQNRDITEVGLVCRGEASVVVNDRERNEYISGVLRPGDFYGVVLIFTHEAPMINIVCDEPVSVLRLSRPDFNRLVDTYSDIREYFYRVALERLTDAYQTLAYEDSPPKPLSMVRLHIPEVIKRSVAFIDDNYMRPLTLEQVASKSGMSKFHFCRTFKAKMNVSFKEYLNRQRIAAAKRHMREQRMKVSEACTAVGFNDLSYFSRVFRTLEGITPSQYRRNF